LVVVTNRDEFYARRTRPRAGGANRFAAWWTYEKRVAPWFGVNRRGPVCARDECAGLDRTQIRMHHRAARWWWRHCNPPIRSAGGWKGAPSAHARLNGFNLLVGDSLALRDRRT